VPGPEVQLLNISGKSLADANSVLWHSCSSNLMVVLVTGSLHGKFLL